MKVKFITDSSADLPKEVVKDLDITVLPIELSFGSEIFLDNVTITNEEFYEKLRKCRELPKTSQINQFVFEDAFRPYKGTDTLVVAIIISSEMSATIEAARRAQQELAMDNLLVVDSQLVTFGLGAYVVEAAKLAKEAQSKEELLEKTGSAAFQSKAVRLCGRPQIPALRRQAFGGEHAYSEFSAAPPRDHAG